QAAPAGAVFGAVDRASDILAQPLVAGKPQLDDLPPLAPAHRQGRRPGRSAADRRLRRLAGRADHTAPLLCVDVGAPSLDIGGVGADTRPAAISVLHERTGTGLLFSSGPALEGSGELASYGLACPS